jgi:hypothetical protein
VQEIVQGEDLLLGEPLHRVCHEPWMEMRFMKQPAFQIFDGSFRGHPGRANPGLRIRLRQQHGQRRRERVRVRVLPAFFCSFFFTAFFYFL